MKENRIIFMFIIIALLIVIVGYFGIKYFKEKQVNIQIEEYIPQEETSEEQLRKTMVNLYFYNNETGNIEKEARLINSTDLIENPYTELVKLLINGPKSEKLKKLLPEDVNVLKGEILGNCVTLDMSIEFLNHIEDKDLKNKMINSIVNTLTELTEVESVKFLINGEPNDEFNEEYVRI